MRACISRRKWPEEILQAIQQQLDMPKYLIDVNLPYHGSLWNSPDFIHQKDLNDEWLDSQIWDYAVEKQLTIVSRDVDFSIRISTTPPPPRVIHFRLGNIKASELFGISYKNWHHIAE
jgi:predicted nuclease of predicted toxin-antitoxin system